MLIEALEVPASPEEAAENRSKFATKSKTEWKRNKVHKDVVCPSGSVIDIQIPNLTQMLEAGEIPNELVDVATAAATSGEAPDAASLIEFAKLQRHLVAKTVVRPTITADDVPDLPPEDIDFLNDIANRRRDVDAVGNQIAGLDTVAKYATFRDQSDSDEDVLYG